eukprot:SAG31_NODE_935_length_10892_cov_7.109886_3_plen_583_part_00
MPGGSFSAEYVFKNGFPVGTPLNILNCRARWSMRWICRARGAVTSSSTAALQPAPPRHHRMEELEPGTENPLSGTAGSVQPRQEEGALEELVISEHFAELVWIGKLCCNDDGRPRILYRIMQLMILVRVATSGGRGYAEAVLGQIYDDEGNPKPNDLHHAASGFYAFFFLMLLFPLADVTRALRPGETGTLALLGAGKRNVSKKDARTLNAIRLCTRAGSSGAVLAAIANLVWYLTIYTQFQGVEFNQQYFWGGLAMAVVLALAVPTLVSGWWLSSRLGSALARTHINEVAVAMQQTPPSDKNLWEACVVQPCMQLEAPLHYLSSGCGRGLAALVAALFSLALLCFVQALNVERSYGWVRAGLLPRGESEEAALERAIWNNVVGTIAVLPLPFILAFDIASTSDMCDGLMQSLNKVAIKAGETLHNRINYLESRLVRMNRGQGRSATLLQLVAACVLLVHGVPLYYTPFLALLPSICVPTPYPPRPRGAGLGFTVAGTVVDLKALRNGGLFIGSGGITLVTFLLALGPSNHSHLFDQDRNATECRVDSLAVSVLASTALALFSNTTACVPDMTLEELLESGA